MDTENSNQTTSLRSPNPLNVFDVLKRTFSSFSQNFKFIIKLSIPFLVAYILSGIFFISYLGLDNLKALYGFKQSPSEIAKVESQLNEIGKLALDNLGWFIFAVVVASFIYFILKTAFNLAVINVAINSQRQGAMDLFKSSLRSLPRYIRHYIIFSLVVFGFVSVVMLLAFALAYIHISLAIVGGVALFIFFAIRLSPMLQVFVAEDKIGIENIQRSLELTKNKFWMMLLNLFVWMLLSLIAIIATGLAFNILTVFIPILGMLLNVLFGLWIMGPLSLIFLSEIYRRLSQNVPEINQDKTIKVLKAGAILGTTLLVAGLFYGIYFIIQNKDEIKSGYSELVYVIKNPEIEYVDSEFGFSLKYPRQWAESNYPLVDSAVVSFLDTGEARAYETTGVTPTYVNVLAYESEGQSVEDWRNIYHSLAESGAATLTDEDPIQKNGDVSTYTAYFIWNESNNFGKITLFHFGDMIYILSAISGRTDFSEADKIVQSFKRTK